MNDDLKKLHGTENFFSKPIDRSRIVTLEEVEMKKRAAQDEADSNIIEERPKQETVVMETKEPEVQEKKKPGPKPKEK